MAINFKGQLSVGEIERKVKSKPTVQENLFKAKVPETPAPKKVVDFESLRKKQPPQVKETPLVEVKAKPPAKEEEKSLINKKRTLRPKHIKDSTISYQSSGYVKDLLGEE